MRRKSSLLLENPHYLYTIAELLKESSVVTFSQLLETCRVKIVITMLTHTKLKGTEFIFLKPQRDFSVCPVAIPSHIALRV